MDIVLVLFASLLSPFILYKSEIPHNHNAGFFVSHIDTSHFVLDPISLGRRGEYSDRSEINYSGLYTLSYDAFWGNKFYVNRDKNNFWLGTRVSWAPFSQRFNTRLYSADTVRPKNTLFIYHENPSLALVAGYDFFDIENPVFWEKLSFSAYGSVGVMKVEYETLKSFDVAYQDDSTLKYSAGIATHIDSKWSLLLEANYFNISGYGLTEINQDINFHVFQLRAGLLYEFNEKNNENIRLRDTTYGDIIEIIDPGLQYRKDEALAEQKEAELKALEESQAAEAARNEEEVRNTEESEEDTDSSSGRGGPSLPIPEEEETESQPTFSPSDGITAF